MTAYLQQRWVITLDDLTRFAQDTGCVQDDIDEMEQCWELFGDGMDYHAEFERTDPAQMEDPTLSAVLTALFEQNPGVDKLFVYR